MRRRNNRSRRNRSRGRRRGRRRLNERTLERTGLTQQELDDVIKKVNQKAVQSALTELAQYGDLSEYLGDALQELGINASMEQRIDIEQMFDFNRNAQLIRQR